ncbi:MAG: hypothetical protein JWM31_2509 [Solirubrobacterales bacterium]|nr:hypothetical protein [Solirubrobacterales bacterium]
MRIVIDGLPLRGVNSTSIVIEHLLGAWVDRDPADELHLLTGPECTFPIPPGVTLHRVDLGSRHYLGRLRAQATVLPRTCRELDAEVMLGVLPTTAIGPLPCPRAIIAWDLRHELRPAQFARKTRVLRRISFDIGFRQADAIVTISERTRDDLLASRPWLRKRIVRAAQLGGDHADRWPAGDPSASPYAITFGQWGNKNVSLVVDAWATLRTRAEVLPLVIVGLSRESKAVLEEKVRKLGLGELVTALPWLSDEEFQARFSSASLVVFPSDFEGFGLPAVEAMRLGIPVVVTADPALLEVTGGHAAVMRGWEPDDLANAVSEAQALGPEALDAARKHAARFTWARTAALTRSALAEAIAADQLHHPVFST